MNERKLPAWQDVLGEAEMLVKQKPIFAKYIKGTILENDVPVWIADFAQRAVMRDRAAPSLSSEAAMRQGLEALQGALKALDAIGDEMTVGERYTNAGQYLIDALEPARAAIAALRDELEKVK